MPEQDRSGNKERRVVNLAVSIGAAALGGVALGLNIGIYELEPALLLTSPISMPFVLIPSAIAIDRFDQFLHPESVSDIDSMT